MKRVPPLLPIVSSTDDTTSTTGCCYGCGTDVTGECSHCGTPICAKCIVGCERHECVCGVIHDEDLVGISLSDGDLAIVNQWKDSTLVARTIDDIKGIDVQLDLHLGLERVLTNGISIFQVNTGKLSLTARVSTRAVPVGTGAMTEKVGKMWYIYPAIILISTDTPKETLDLEKSHKRALEYLDKNVFSLMKDAQKAAEQKFAAYKKKGLPCKKTTGVGIKALLEQDEKKSSSPPIPPRATKTTTTVGDQYAPCCSWDDGGTNASSSSEDDHY
jgi:hypothetical protein